MKRIKHPIHQTGLSIVDLIAVVAVIGILVAILVPKVAIQNPKLGD